MTILMPMSLMRWVAVAVLGTQASLQESSPARLIVSSST